jgi:hypothetical protein
MNYFLPGGGGLSQRHLPNLRAALQVEHSVCQDFFAQAYPRNVPGEAARKEAKV